MAKDPGVETIIVVREPRRDRLDDPTEDLTTQHWIEGCQTLPRSSHEEGRGWVIIEGRMVIAPYGSDVVGSDKVVVDGVLWDVEGEPGHYQKRKKGKATIFYLKRQGT